MVEQESYNPNVMVLEAINNSSELKQWLEMEGYRVVEAADEQDAIENAKHESPHLILIDVNHPSRDNLLVARRICQEAELPDVPIVIVDRADFHGMVNCVGHNEYVVHLNDYDQLEDLLTRLLPKSRAVGS